MEITSYLLGKKSGGGGDEPTGTIEITSNGVKNVKSYASANVNVQPDLESKSITITENTTTTITPTTGKDGLSSVQVTTNVSGGGGGLDWSAIGYSEEPQSITDDYNYAKDIYDNWDSTITDLSSKFSNNTTIRIMPLVDTSNATNTSEMFRVCPSLTSVPLLDISNSTTCSNLFKSCSQLKRVPLLNTEKVVNMNAMFADCILLKDVPVLDTSKLIGSQAFQNTFSNCPSLTDQSLNNILQMCINATQYTSTKTLARLGFNSTNYPSSRIQTLSHYQDFIDAGWTIGY